MQKWLSCILAILLLTGCSQKTSQTTAPPTALEALSSVWELHSQEERFAVMGGDMENIVEGKPGEYSMTARENLQYDVLLPADILADVQSAATMIHAMNRNQLTSVALTLQQGTDEKACATAIRESILDQQWLCGFPDRLFVAAPAEGVMVMAFGTSPAIDTFVEHFDEAWANARVFTWEDLA